MDPAVAAKMESGWCALSSSDSKSLLKKYLTKEVFDQLKDKKTEFGSTLLDCVQSGKIIFCSLKICRKSIIPIIPLTVILMSLLTSNYEQIFILTNVLKY